MYDPGNPYNDWKEVDDSVERAEDQHRFVEVRDPGNPLNIGWVEAEYTQMFPAGGGPGRYTPVETGVKYDSDKPRMDLLDSVALDGLAKVLTFGAKKYNAHNWRGGISYSRLVAALLRHTFAILRGEDNDPESGLPHVDHIGCCWMFLSNMMKTRPDLDDRWKAK